MLTKEFLFGQQRTDRESDMNIQIKTFEIKPLVVLNTRGTVDLTASKAAMKFLVDGPDFGPCSEVLLDFRNVECDMSASSVFELVKHMARHIPTLYDDHRIAVLVKYHAPGNLAFNHAQFLELCTYTKGFNIRAYEDSGHAIHWLHAVSASDSNRLDHAQTPMPSLGGSGPQFGPG